MYFNNIGVQKIEDSYTWSNGLVSAIEFANNLNIKEIFLSDNVCNTDKKDIFIRYATKFDLKEKYLKINDFIKYIYIRNEKIFIDFSTTEREYKQVYINIGDILKEDVYVIYKDDCNLINNLNDFNIYEFNKYFVLIKNNY